MRFNTKRGDTRTALKATLTPVDAVFTDVATVDFRMCTRQFENVINRAVNVFSAPDVTVVFTASEIDREGVFLGEFKLTFTDGRIETIPKEDYIRIYIDKKAGD